MQFRGPQVIGHRGADTIVNPANPATAIDDPKVDAYTVVWQHAYFLGTATVGYPGEAIWPAQSRFQPVGDQCLQLRRAALQHGRGCGL
jgi:hypothetical protein